ncbi:vWA domain-containing protein [Halorussus marinus]|uniref:vWA domain-containing protein n=1 Tax=Halorussus marinus TaxID=2505976 RepID=UPI00143CFF36|nr:BatA and WFA domain-containing protein [Halorussus marinus]
MSLGGMLSSAFLRPLGLAALAAAVPLLLLYLRKPDPTRVAFPAVEFLLGDREERRSRPAFRRFRRNAVLVIQLFAIGALAVTLAAPYVPVSEQRTVEETVLVVDRSASMATQSEGATRFDRAVDAARDDVSAETSVVLSGAATEITVRRAPATAAREALGDLAVTGAPGDLSEAIERAVAVAGEDARIVVVSDFADAGWRTAVSAARARGYSVDLRQFDGGGSTNVGVVDRSFADGAMSVRIRNFGDSRTERRIELGDASRSLTLAPGDAAEIALPVPVGGGRLRLAPSDDFALDDSVPIAAPDDPEIDVLVVTNRERRPLVAALSVIRGTDVTVTRPPASVSGEYDAVVFSVVEPGRLLDGTLRVARETLSRGGGVVIQAQPNLSAVGYGDLLPIEPNGTATDPAVGRAAESRLTEGVTFPAPESYVTADLRAGRALLRTANGTPLLATASIDGGRVLYYGYPANGSAFAHNYRYPVFWKRALFDLTGRRPLADLNRETGDRLQFESVTTVGTPTGTIEAESVTLRRVGVYAAGGERYAASLASRAESNVSAPPVSGGSPGAGTETESRTVPLELTPVAAGIAALAALAELAFLRYRGDL